MKSNKELVIDAYNQIADRYCELWFNVTPQDVPYVENFLTFLKKGAYVLDAGCGVGGWVKYLLEKGYKVTGIDLSQGMLEVAKRKVPDGDFKSMDILNMSFKDESFDAVIAAHLLIHIPHERFSTAFSEIHRVLKPSGYLLVMGAKNEVAGIVNEPLKAGVQTYLSKMTLESVESSLKETGFDILVKEEVPVIGLDGSEDVGLVFICKK